MKSYENENRNKEKWFAIVSHKKSNDKIHIWVQLCSDEETLRDYLKYNEPKYRIDEIKLVKNNTPLLFFNYWNKFPITDNEYKFDFVKFVLDADISLEYRKELEV